MRPCLSKGVEGSKIVAIFDPSTPFPARFIAKMRYVSCFKCDILVNYSFLFIAGKNMDKQLMEIHDTFVSSEEWICLVQFCTHTARNRDIAEDLAQETLLEAWKHKDSLRNKQRRGAWIFGIARNVCLRWLRKQRRDMSYLLQVSSEQETVPPGLEEVLADDFDVEHVLERKELIELLDRALALLPAQTRTVLIQRYVEESALAEIAAKLGTNASTIAMRIQRGKLLLRHILIDEMNEEESYPEYISTEQWEVTPLWCYICGQHHLLGQRDPDLGKLMLKCPGCNVGSDEILNKNQLSALKGIRGYKPLYARLASWCNRYYRMGLANSAIDCIQCGRTIPVAITVPEQFPRWMKDKEEMRSWMQHPEERLVTMLCEHCTASYITTLDSLVLTATEGQDFLKRHIRIRTLPKQYLEFHGRPAILTRFESITDSATLDILSDEETYEVIASYRDTYE